MTNIKLNDKSTANEIAQAYALYTSALNNSEYDTRLEYLEQTTHSILLNAIKQNNTDLAMQIMRGLVYSSITSIFNVLNIKVDMTGKAITHHQNGMVEYEFNLLNNKLDGICKVYDQDGNTKTEELYSDDVLINKVK